MHAAAEVKAECNPEARAGPGEHGGCSRGCFTVEPGLRFASVSRVLPMDDAEPALRSTLRTSLRSNSVRRRGEEIDAPPPPLAQTDVDGGQS